MSIVTVEGWDPTHDGDERYYRVLEEGRILFFPKTPFELSGEDRSFLLEQRMVRSGYHKNIAYRPGEDRVANVGRGAASDDRRLRDVMRRYSRAAVAFLEALLPRYAGRMRIDLASFRPEEEEGRQLPLRARNDLLHVDAFPTRPTRGDRILRLFTNINPDAARVWVTAETFDELAERFARSPAFTDRVRRGRLRRAARRLARLAGLPVADRSPYDEHMLAFHHFLKENADYQRSARKVTLSFPPGATWLVFTDMATHSVLRGRYALEQTVIVSREAMALPAKAPISILEEIARGPMA